MPKHTDDDAYDDSHLQTFSKLHFNDICCASANQEGPTHPSQNGQHSANLASTSFHSKWGDFVQSDLAVWKHLKNGNPYLYIMHNTKSW